MKNKQMKRFKFSITWNMTDELLKQAISLDNKVFTKSDAGSFSTCKK